MRLLSIHLLIVFAALGCDDKADPVPSGSGSDSGTTTETITETATETVQNTGETTYSEHVKPILDKRCIFCHSSKLGGANRKGAPLGVDFNTYQVSKDSASKADTRIQAGTMPPSGPLPEEDKQLFADWVDDGLLE